MKWFCLGWSQVLPCIWLRHVHCPVSTSQWLSKEPPGSQLHMAQPSWLSDKPNVSGIHWLQSLPVTSRLHVHSPVCMLHPELLIVPIVLHVQLSQPSTLNGSRFQKPSLHVSHRRPCTFFLQWHAPASIPFSSSLIESQMPSSSDPDGSQSHAKILVYINNSIIYVSSSITYAGTHVGSECLHEDHDRRTECILHNVDPEYCVGNCRTYRR